MATPTLNLARPYDDRQANVRASEGSGTTILTIADSKWQIFNLSAARTVVLPSTSVKAGDVYRLDNISGLNALTVQASNNTQIGSPSAGGCVEIVALVDSPTTAANWRIYLNSASILGRTDGNPVPAGFIGEVISAASAPNISGTLAAYLNIILTPGSWRIDAMATLDNPVSNNFVLLAVGTTPGSLTGTTVGIDRIYGAATSNGGSACVIGKIVNISSNTTYYCNAQSGGSTSAGLKIQGTRIG